MTQDRLKEMWCSLNAWATPQEFPRHLSESEISGALLAIGLMFKYSDLMSTWNKKIDWKNYKTKKGKDL
jgi:hypothetical protein